MDTTNAGNGELLQCTHLQPVQQYLSSLHIKITYRGQPWGNNCRDWIYYDCIVSAKRLIERLKLDTCVEVHDYQDIKVGSEMGLYCRQCQDAILGPHPNSVYAKGLQVIV